MPNETKFMHPSTGANQPLRHAGTGWPAKVALMLGVGITFGLWSCGGGDSGGVSNTSAEISISSAVETGAATKILAVPGGMGAADALFPDGRVYYSPDGYNLGGGGATIAGYSGNLTVLDTVAVGGGIDALLSDGSVVFSPDGKNLGGGGASKQAYKASTPVTALIAVGSGVDAVIGDGSGGVVYSPDGLNLGGGGRSVVVYPGPRAVTQIVALGGTAVLTLFADGQVWYSPNNSQLGGGGSTVLTSSASSIVRLVPVGGGVLSQFSSGSVYLSPDGRNLAGGGSTIAVTAWNASFSNGPFAARDSAHGTEFLGHLWLSGGFADPSGTDSCFATCSFYDLWASTDSLGATWNVAPSFATATQPVPRDIQPVLNNGVMDAPVPTDFYDSYSALVAWQGQLMAIGATVWRSADGINWARNNQPDGTAVPGPAPIRATENSRALILGGTLFFLQPDSGRVYSSTDATASQWTDLGAITNFTPRCGSAAFVLQQRMWIVGGGACNYSATYNDIWSTADGVNWTKSVESAAWSGRMWPCVAISTDGVAWLVGGYAPTDWNNESGTITPRYGANHADVWYSKNGSTWKQFKADTGSKLPDDGRLEPRHAPTCYVTAGSPENFMIMAGSGGTDPNGANARVISSIRSVSLPSASILP